MPADKPKRVEGDNYIYDFAQFEDIHIINPRKEPHNLFRGMNHRQLMVLILRLKKYSYKDIHKIYPTCSISTMKRWIRQAKNKYPDIERYL